MWRNGSHVPRARSDSIASYASSRFARTHRSLSFFLFFLFPSTSSSTSLLSVITVSTIPRRHRARDRCVYEGTSEWKEWMSSRGECIRITRRRVPSRPPRERERERERVVEFRVGSTMVLYRYTHDCMFTNCLILPANRYQAHFSCRRIDRREKRWTTPTFLDRSAFYPSSIPLFPFAAVEKSFEREREREGERVFEG